MYQYSGRRVSARDLINSSKRMLDANEKEIALISRFFPVTARVLMQRHQELARQQRTLETKYREKTVGNMGFAFLVPLAIAAGASVVGILGLAWKQHEAVSLEKDKLKQYRECVDNKVARNIGYEQAEADCSEIYFGTKKEEGFKGFVENIAKLSKYSIILLGALVGTYIVFKVIRKKK